MRTPRRPGALPVVPGRGRHADGGDPACVPLIAAVGDARCRYAGLGAGSPTLGRAVSEEASWLYEPVLSPAMSGIGQTRVLGVPGHLHHLPRHQARQNDGEDTARSGSAGCCTPGAAPQRSGAFSCAGSPWPRGKRPANLAPVRRGLFFAGSLTWQSNHEWPRRRVDLVGLRRIRAGSQSRAKGLGSGCPARLCDFPRPGVLPPWPQRASPSDCGRAPACSGAITTPLWKPPRLPAMPRQARCGPPDRPPSARPGRRQALPLAPRGSYVAR